MGIFERYTEKSRRTMVNAKHEADRFGASEVSPEHILLALLMDSALIGSTKERFSVEEIRTAINDHLPRLEPNPLPHDLPLSTEARTALVLATEEADKLDQRYVQNEHVLLGLVQSQTSYAAQVLKQNGLTPQSLRTHMSTLPQPKEALNPKRESKPPSPEIDLIRMVGELVSRGQGQRALQLIDDFIAEPGQDRKLRMRVIGHFAAITALQIGDLKASQRYCEERVTSSPDDPLALYALADCLARQGKTDEARRRAADGHKAALSRSDESGKRVIELIERRFPELRRQANTD